MNDGMAALSSRAGAGGRGSVEGASGIKLASLGAGSSRVGGGQGGGAFDPAAGTQAAPGRAAAESASAPGQRASAPTDSRAVLEKYETRESQIKAPTSICQLPAIAAGLGGAMEGLDNLSAQGALVGEKAPRLHPHSPRPVFPLDALARQEQGRVLLRAEVLDNGTVRKVILKQSSGSKALDRAAFDAIHRWRFFPAERDGKAVTAWVDVPIDYRNPSQFSAAR
jgi:protein TonB